MRLLPALLLCAAVPAAAATPPAPTPAERARLGYESVRRLLLTTSPTLCGLREGIGEPIVFGVVMDMILPSGETATMATFCTGELSFRYSIDSYEYDDSDDPAVTEAGLALVAAAPRRLDVMRRTENFPFPRRGQVSLFVLTTRGVFGATRSVARLESGRDSLSPLYAAAQRAMATFRRAHGPRADHETRMPPP